MQYDFISKQHQDLYNFCCLSLFYVVYFLSLFIYASVYLFMCIFIYYLFICLSVYSFGETVPPVAFVEVIQKLYVGNTISGLSEGCHGMVRF